MVINFKLSEYKLTEEYKMLQEMAYSISDAKEFLEESEQQRIENLMQIFIVGGETINHWCNELCACCHETKVLKSTKRRFPEEIIYKYIWKDVSESFYVYEQQYCMNIADKEGLDNLPEYESEDLFNFITDYHKWLANKLANNDRVYSKQVKEEINYLLDKYK